MYGCQDYDELVTKATVMGTSVKQCLPRSEMMKFTKKTSNEKVVLKFLNASLELISKSVLQLFMFPGQSVTFCLFCMINVWLTEAWGFDGAAKGLMCLWGWPQTRGQHSSRCWIKTINGDISQPESYNSSFLHSMSFPPFKEICCFPFFHYTTTKVYLTFLGLVLELQTKCHNQISTTFIDSAWLQLRNIHHQCSFYYIKQTVYIERYFYTL